jgi:hypothetical protein
MSGELVAAAIGFFGALVAAALGAWVGFRYAVKLDERKEQRTAEGIRLQLKVILEEVYTFVINRGRGQAGGSTSYDFPGWRESLGRLVNRAYSLDVWTALGDQAKPVYDAATATEYTMELAEKVSDTARYGQRPAPPTIYAEVWRRAWIALDRIAKARIALGGTVSQFDLDLIKQRLIDVGEEAEGTE